jgi:hypothetical protein
MKNALNASKALAIASLFLVAACSGGAGSGSGGSLYIESCSLGCGDGQGGNQVACSIDLVGINPELVVLFSGPVDLQSVDNQSFQVQNANDGSIPAFDYALDPLNSNRLIARPSLSLDSAGNPVFALEPNETYLIKIPGTAQGDDGPFVHANGGGPNESRLSCTVQTTTEVLDTVPGAPKARIFVDTLIQSDVEIVSGPADVSDVLLSSQITIVFDDLMNIATLSSPQTGNAPFARVMIDPDGNTNNITDQVPVGGSWTAFWDQDLFQTTFVFTPEVGFPASGSGPIPRKIVIDLPEQISDLVGNGLDNAGLFYCVPEAQPFDDVILPDEDGENFDDDDNHAIAFSGSGWGEDGVDEGGNSFEYLGFGLSGGSGRLGELVIGAGEVVTLDTTSQEFPLVEQVRDLLDNNVPTTPGSPGDYDPTDPESWPTITITDGRFEFSRLTIKGNGRLVLTGSNPGRVYSRGELIVDGILDCTGETAVDHQSNSYNDDAIIGPDAQNNDNIDDFVTPFGGPGGAGGPAAGGGGAGGDRFDHTASSVSVNSLGGINNPGAVIDGQAGDGVGGFNIAGFGQGTGGLHWPNNVPTNNQHSGAIGDVDYSVVMNVSSGSLECRVASVGQPGAGGGYALAGNEGIPSASGYVAVNPGVISNLPANTQPGDLSGLNIEAPGSQPIARGLVGGLLRGGSGGGGGGMHLWGIRNNASPNETGDACFGGSTSFFFPYWDHSGAGGGGGGGALQLNSGNTITVNGQIDCSGGGGGSATILNQDIWACTNSQQAEEANKIACGAFASPGGAGSGGAIKIQAPTIDIQSVSDRMIVAGGVGGEGVGGSLGGDGGPGLVRYEVQNGPLQDDPTGQATLASEVAPYIAPYNPGDPSFNAPHESAAILSVGRMKQSRVRPESMSGAMSCWMKPEGNFFQLTFNGDEDADSSGTIDPDEMGWNMDVVYEIGVDGSGDPILDLMPYRGVPDVGSEPNFPISGESFEDYLGQTLNHDELFGSLFTIRFQGARLNGLLQDACDVSLGGVTSDIAEGSLTPWVRHPEELGLFSPSPNMVRFCIIFEESMKDHGHPKSLINEQIHGVTNLSIAVTPD